MKTDAEKLAYAIATLAAIVAVASPQADTYRLASNALAKLSEQTPAEPK